MPGYFLNSGVLFNVAKNAAKNAASGISPNESPLVATVFSVVGAEAYINEAIELASSALLSMESQPNSVAAFAEMERQIEDSHGSLELKYQVAKWVFSSEAFDKGTNPYQDFALLVATRNALIHHKLLDKINTVPQGNWEMEVPPIVERLRSKKVLREISRGAHGSWLMRIGTPAMAVWSCRAASGMVNAIAAIPPEGLFRVQLGLLAKSFDVDGL